LRLGRAVEALKQTVGDFGVEPAQDAVPVALMVRAASMIGASRRGVAQKYHLLRKAVAATTEGWS